MTRSSPPPLPPPVPDSNGAGGLAFDGAGAGFWTPVGLGVLGGMFGVVLAAGASVALQPGNGGASDSTAIVASESDNGGSPLTRFSGNRSDAASQAEGRDTRPLEPAGSSLPAGGLPGDTRQLPADSMEPVGPGGERRVPPASSGDGDDGGGVAAGRRENSALPSEPNTGQDTPQAGHDGASNDPRAEERWMMSGPGKVCYRSPGLRHPADRSTFVKSTSTVPRTSIWRSPVTSSRTGTLRSWNSAG